MEIKYFAGLCIAVMANGALAQSFSNTIFFADSDSDSGRYKYVPLTGYGLVTGPAFTTNPGPEWTVALGQRFGITVTPSDAPGGGNNYAAGGARVAYTDPARLTSWSATTQVSTYLASTGGRADPNALYTFRIGINDLKTSTAGGAGNIVSPENIPALTALGLQTSGLVAQLATAGAKYFLVFNTGTTSSAVQAAANGGAFVPATVASRTLYDQVVFNDIAARGINVIPVDVDSLFRYVQLNPAPFGITHVSISTPACGATPSFNCSPANYVTPDADLTYFFADNVAGGPAGHVTSAVQRIESDYVYSLITAPSRISMLAETPIQSRLSTVESFRNQIPLSFAQNEVWHAWVSGDVSRLKYTSDYNGFPDSSGTPAFATVGIDYRVANEWIVGGGLSYGSLKQKYSSGGDYTQHENTYSAYAAYKRDAYWANVIASYGALDDHVNRQIALGISSQANVGNTNGSNKSLSIEGGYSFENEVNSTRLIHGPVVGAIFQNVRVDGFTETNSSGAPTALSFSGQRVNSSVSQLGYAASFKAGIWQPFAKLAWSHEWADKERNVTASLISFSAPSYYMPSIQTGKNWEAGTLGLAAELAKNVKGYATLNAQAGQSSKTFSSASLGLNIGF